MRATDDVINDLRMLGTQLGNEGALHLSLHASVTQSMTAVDLSHYLTDTALDGEWYVVVPDDLRDAAVYRSKAALVAHIRQGQHKDIRHIVQFHAVEGTSRAVTEDIAREVLHALDDEPAACVRDFLERELGCGPVGRILIELANPDSLSTTG